MPGKIAIAMFSTVIISGCATSLPDVAISEKESGYTYIPVDPFSVETAPGRNCLPISQPQTDEEYEEYLKAVKNLKFSPLLQSFPDNAVRMSLEKFDSSGSVTYGPAGIGLKGESYRVTVDYVNSDTTNFPVWIAKQALNESTSNYEHVNLLSSLEEKYDPETIVYTVKSDPPYLDETSDALDKNFVEFNIPVYVGIGLRITANVDVIGTNANISGLGAIGAEAESNSLKGSLIVQTLGVNGKSIAAALPIQSELNRTTSANAITAVGAIKALLYDDNTVVWPRVVGIYLPFPGGKPLVNAIISELSREKILWRRSCVS